jgi:cytochrome P450
MTRRVRILAVLLPFYISSSLIEKRNQQLQMTKDKVARRLAKPNDRDDIFAHILSNKQIPAHEAFIFSNSQTLTIAGSETTANTLTAAVHYLSENETALKRLQEEVRGAFNTKEDIDGDSAAELPYLNAVIDESLRIFTPVPFGLPRYCPGAIIDGVWIPKGVRQQFLTLFLLALGFYFMPPPSFLRILDSSS